MLNKENSVSPVVVITGGSSGIGKAASECFAANGYKVYELSRRGVTTSDVRHIDCDVTSPKQCQSAVEEVMLESGKIDLLVCNAGMGISGPIEFTEISEATRQMDVNFFGTVHIIQAVIPHMRSVRAGRILIVSSLASIFPIPFQSFYSASKSALNAFGLALRNELRPFGITVGCLLPGDVQTGFTDARQKSRIGSAVYTRLDQAVSAMERDERGGIAPERMAKKLLYMAQASHLKAYDTVGLKYHIVMFLSKIFPTAFLNWVVGKIY